MDGMGGGFGAQGPGTQDPFLRQMIDAGLVDDRMRMLMQAMQRGQALRATPSAQGMNVGQTYRASSPLEHLATAMSRYRGEKMIGEAEGQMPGLLDQKRQGVAAQVGRDMGPPPAEWNMPPGLTRSESVGLLKPNAPRRPVPAAWKEQLVGRGVDPMSIDSMDEEQAFQFLKQAPKEDKTPPTPEQLARGSTFGLFPAEGEGSESFEKAIRAAKMASEDARRQAGVTYLVGGDERFYGLPTRLPVGGAVPPPKPVPAPAGGSEGFRKDKDLSASERARLSDIAGDVKHIESLAGDFKDEFAGMGPLGGASVWAAQRAGSVGTEGMQRLGEFWSRYERMINIPERHEKFGSALTPQEKQSWDAARNIRPGVSPEVARRAFSEVATITRNVMQRIGDALVADGYGADAVAAATGGLYSRGGAASPDAAPADTASLRSKYGL